MLCDVAPLVALPSPLGPGKSLLVLLLQPGHRSLDVRVIGEDTVLYFGRQKMFDSTAFKTNTAEESVETFAPEIQAALSSKGPHAKLFFCEGSFRMRTFAGKSETGPRFPTTRRLRASSVDFEVLEWREECEVVHHLSEWRIAGDALWFRCGIVDEDSTAEDVLRRLQCV